MGRACRPGAAAGVHRGITNALLRGEAPDCHCFGQLQSEPARRGTLARNVVLAAMAAFVTVEGPGPSVTAWVGDRSAAELVAVAAGIAAVVLGALLLRLWQSNRDLRRHLDNAHAELAAFPPGLPVGAPAPGFSLPNIDGETVTLDALRAAADVVLVFVSPGCGPCQTWSPELLRWQAMLANEITIAMISDGTPAQNRAIFGDGGAQVLVQEKLEVMKAYRVNGSPVTVLVNAEGMVASKPISGAIAGESFIRLTVRRAGRLPDPARSPQRSRSPEKKMDRRAALEDFVQRNRWLHRRAELDRAAVAVLDSFEGAGVRSLLLKGPVLARLLYGSLEAHRDYFDIDLLVGPPDLAKARRRWPGWDTAGATRAWNRRRGQGRSHRALGAAGEYGPLWVDLHKRLAGGAAGCRASDDVVWAALWGRRSSIEFAGRETTVLAEGGLAFHLALHAARGGPDEPKAIGRPRTRNRAVGAGCVARCRGAGGGSSGRGGVWRRSSSRPLWRAAC